MEEADIRYYSKWPKKAENERLSRESEEKRLPVTMGMPTRATINTTTRCNLSCGFCRYHGQEKIGYEELPFETFMDISEQLFPYIKEYHATTKGEPFMNSYFDESIDMIKKYGVKLNLTTNGMLLTRSVSETIVPVLRDLKVSLDGAEKSTLENLRCGSNYEVIIRNIENFVEARDKYATENAKDGVYIPTITIQSVLMKENIKELPRIVKIAHSLGVDRVKGFNLSISLPEYKRSSLLFNQEEANIYLKEASEIAQELGMQTKYQEPFDPAIDVFNYEDGIARKRDCAFLWRQISIDPNGDVRPCCHDFSPVMGSIYETDIKDIWNNEKYQDMRKMLDSENPLYCCSHCAMLDRKVVDAKAFIIYSI